MRRNSPMDQPSRNSSGNPTTQHARNVISQITIAVVAAGSFFDSKNQREDKKVADLRSPAHAGQLHRRTDRRERKDEHGARETQRRQSAAERVRDPHVNQHDQQPVRRCISEQRARSPQVRIPRNPSLNPSRSAAIFSRQPFRHCGMLQLSSQPLAAVIPKINQKRDQHDHADEQQRSRRTRHLHKRRILAADQPFALERSSA